MQGLVQRMATRQGAAEDVDTHHLSPRVMSVLCHLADRQGDVVPRRELLDHVWHGMIVTDDVLTQCISELRATLGDDRSAPSYIKTIPKKGYMLIATVAEVDSTPVTMHPAARLPRGLAVISALVLLLAASFAGYLGLTRDTPDYAIAVLPFRDLSGDDHDFSSGLVQDINRKLTNAAGFRVVAVGVVAAENGDSNDPREVGRRLAADMVLDGTVRVAKGRLRITVQLIDARDGFQVWSDVFEAPAGDMFGAQEGLSTDIVSGISRSLSLRSLSLGDRTETI